MYDGSSSLTWSLARSSCWIIMAARCWAIFSWSSWETPGGMPGGGGPPDIMLMACSMPIPGGMGGMGMGGMGGSPCIWQTNTQSEHKSKCGTVRTRYHHSGGIDKRQNMRAKDGTDRLNIRLRLTLQTELDCGTDRQVTYGSRSNRV